MVIMQDTSRGATQEQKSGLDGLKDIQHIFISLSLIR